MSRNQDVATLSLYQMLDVTPSATEEEIENAYKRVLAFLDVEALARYSLIDDQDADEIRSQVKQAHDTLMNPEQRAAYDKALSVDLSYPSVLVPTQARDTSVSFGQLESESNHEPPMWRDRMVGIPQVEATNSSRLEHQMPQARNQRPVSGGGAPSVSAKQFQVSATESLTRETEYSGSMLRHLRESAGASLQNLSDLTKISKRYLRALEEHDFSALPAAVYVRGFVVEFARALGLPAEEVAKSYMALYKRFHEKI